jgi:hypothetical protein
MPDIYIPIVGKDSDNGNPVPAKRIVIDPDPKKAPAYRSQRGVTEGDRCVERQHYVPWD